MKKKFCLALSLLMIMMTLLVPMAAWAEPEEGGGQEGTVTEEPVEPEQPEKEDNGGEQKVVEKKATTSKSDTSSAKKSPKTTNSSKSTARTYDQNTNVPAVKEKKESKIEKDTVSIIFTGDIHSHLDEFKIREDGKTRTRGGFARFTTIFEDISPDYIDDSYILDAGDFSMGTAYQAIFRQKAAELRMLGYLGYDAVTLGNHEFDYGSAGLAQMLLSAKKLSKDEKYDLPKVCISNIDWDKTLAEPEFKENAAKLQSAFEKTEAVEDYVVLKKNDTKIAVFGIFGKDSDACAPDSNLYFKDQAETAKNIVAEIKKNEKNIDLIVCISHSGVCEKNKDMSEDEDLAAAVPDIDLIISGHSHEKTDKAVMVGDTAVVAAGCFGEYVGHITYKKEKSGYSLDEFKLITAGKSIEQDKATLNELSTFKNELNSSYFKEFGYTADKVIAKNNISFTSYEDFGSSQGEDTLGNLLADSFVYSVEKADGKKGDKVDVAIVPEGIVRDTFVKGDITAGDAFGILSLGEGADGLAGYPLVSAYVTGKELKNIAEIDATVSDSMEYVRLYMSGLTYKINPNRLKLNRAFDIKLGNGKKLKDVDADEMYRVVTDMYTAKRLADVTDMSKGLLSIVPKNKDGSIIIDFNKAIVKDGKAELKAWSAVAGYLEHMGTVSSKYEDNEGRKVISDSRNLRELICQPNKMGWLVRLGVLIPIAIILLVLLIIWIRRHRRRSNMMFSISEREKKAIFAPPKRQKNLFANNDRRRKRNRRNGRF